MKPNVRDPNCPTRAVLNRIGDRWTALIVLVLLDGPQRFTHLRTEVGGISPKVLSETLRRLERDGIVTRTAHAEIPPRRPVSGASPRFCVSRRAEADRRGGVGRYVLHRNAR